MIVVIILAVGAYGISTARAAANTTIQNDYSDLCMTSLDGGVGTAVEQYTCDGTSAQLWQFISGYAGGTEFRNAADGLCMSDLGNINYYEFQYMETCDGSENQSYGFTGLFPREITPDDDSSIFCLSTLGEAVNNSHIVEYRCDNTTAQKWYD